MKNLKRIIIPIVIIIALIAVFLVAYNKLKPGAQEGSKAYTVSVTDDKGEVKTYEARSDAETLHEALDDLASKEDFSIEVTDSEYGAYIDAVNGITADFETDMAYWAIYVNGEYGQYGIDEQSVADGDEFGLVYEISQ